MNDLPPQFSIKGVVCVRFVNVYCMSKSLDPFHKISYYINWAKTSVKYSMKDKKYPLWTQQYYIRVDQASSGWMGTPFCCRLTRSQGLKHATPPINKLNIFLRSKVMDENVLKNHCYGCQRKSSCSCKYKFNIE